MRIERIFTFTHLPTNYTLILNRNKNKYASKNNHQIITEHFIMNIASKKKGEKASQEGEKEAQEGKEKIEEGQTTYGQKLNPPKLNIRNKENIL